MGYLTTFPVNPWGQDYEVEVKLPPNTATLSSGVPYGCSFSVTTNVPKEVSEAFISFLPQARCEDPAWCKPQPAGQTKPANYVRCCSFVPKPGVGLSGPCPPPRHITVVGSDVKCEL